MSSFFHADEVVEVASSENVSHELRVFGAFNFAVYGRGPTQHEETRMDERELIPPSQARSPEVSPEEGDGGKVVEGQPAADLPDNQLGLSETQEVPEACVPAPQASAAEVVSEPVPPQADPTPARTPATREQKAAVKSSRDDPFFDDPELPPPMREPEPSKSALDKRIRRALQPNAAGNFKVAQRVRDLWENGEQDKVFQLFAECDNNVEKFVKTHSVSLDKEKEFEVGVYFTFKTETEMADMPETLARMLLIFERIQAREAEHHLPRESQP